MPITSQYKTELAVLVETFYNSTPLDYVESWTAVGNNQRLSITMSLPIGKTITWSGDVPTQTQSDCDLIYLRFLISMTTLLRGGRNPFGI